MLATFPLVPVALRAANLELVLPPARMDRTSRSENPPALPTPRRAPISSPHQRPPLVSFPSVLQASLHGPSRFAALSGLYEAPIPNMEQILMDSTDLEGMLMERS